MVKQRLDRWLFFARAVKSRTLAQKLIETGAVRVNSERTTRTDHPVGEGDVLIMTVHTRLLVWKIADPGDRRGPASEAQALYDVAMDWQSRGVPMLVIAGKEYGTGSSRDWAAKGTALLGVRAVIAESFERIHRSNLVGMGVLPLEFVNGETRTSLGLTGFEHYDIQGLDDAMMARATLTVVAKVAGGEKRFEVRSRIDTPEELNYYKHGGILPYVLRQLAGRAG